ncbi:T9SS type A sorting domain-containing protein [Winogradskyella sp. Asnod2-B02-A]|uniref:T9SS type A sorting domain-containing protein n=1 Tax=Winogradskyella sp. Asnod2-B02-A TaxID=3160583 RepID=UPI003870E61A
MKKITLKFLMAIALLFSYSGMAQTLNEAAGWPSADWTISGTYTAAGLLSDPTVDATFGFDDDAAGFGSLDDVQATSPIIDLTAASTAGETWITISGEIVFRSLGEILILETYDADAMTWSVAETFEGNSTNTDYQSCAGTVAYTSSVVNIAGYTATQLSGFQYRFSYDDLDGYQWGFCLSSPTITSATPPSCPDPIALAASPTGIDTADITWSAGNMETDWTYEYGVSPYVQGDGGTTGTVMTTPLLSLSSLTPGETYDIYVQANCGASGDSSYVTVQWSQPLLGEECSTAISATVETDCSTATPISLDFDNGGSETLTSCDAFGNVGYWVAFTPTATGAVTINVNGSTALGVAIYDACGGTEILCNNNTLAASTVVVDLTPSTEYLAYFWLDTAAGVIDVCFEEYIVPTAPDCVANPLPVSGEVDIAVGAVTLTWEAPTTGPVPTSYNLYSGTESDGSDLTLEGNYTDLTADLNVAGFDTTIYWQVRPLNGVSIATGCAIWSFTTESAPIGATCETAIDVAALPYTTTDDTASYGDDYSASPGATGCGTTSSYLNGDDVVYAYTATADATINIAMSAIGSTYSGLFVYTDCANIGTECVAGYGNGGITDDYSLEVSVTNGTTYYIVISTWATPQSTTYTLDITENTCVNAEATYTVVEDCANTQFSVDVDVTSLGTATSVTVSDDQGSADQQVSTTGIVSFGPYASGTTINYSILNDQDASCETIGSASYSCPPTNDECLNATVLTPGAVFADNPVDGTVAGATADAEAASCGSDGAGVWYSIVVPASGDVTIQVGDDSSGGTGFDSVIEAFTGTCGALTSLECDDDDVPGFGDNYSQLELTGLTGGETIYVRVWEYLGDEVEPFSISAYSASLSVGNVENEVAFTYYPNPVKNTLTLNAQNTIEQVAMYNMLGQEVLRVTPNTVDSDINMSSLQTGAYFVKVTIGNVTETIRVIKQ